MGTTLTLWLLPALPLAGAVILLLAGRASNTWGHWLGCATALASFAVAGWAFFDMLGRAAADRPVAHSFFGWVPVAGLQADFALRLDQLSMCFALLITGVGSLIHLYSVGYMSHDPGRRRFFAYLNLFLAAMLVLVLADNYLVLYLGWEGVGLASYLLIGFWHEKPSAATAAKKAFVVNRVGDMGLAIALFVMFATFGSVDFGQVFAGAPQASEGTLTALGLLLLLGACGKSAQVPLQSWLGDAMEGPTPVSALIHAATMVTAGVYLIARSGPIFDLAPGARAAVMTVGAVTLLFGAIIGCAKDDIKKALAASTMSQIGYMVLAAGLGPIGYAAAIMHLLTHGFFKAGLFLGAGSVMHGMNDETDMRRYGGLRKVMPITYVTFGLGYLAIIGVPPFSGFFSKDRIIESAFAFGGVGGVVTGIAALLGAGITAFYMTRVMLLTFFGERRWHEDAHPHESPAVMTGPMILLAFGSVGAGGLLVLGSSLQNWLEPVVGVHHGEAAIPAWAITVLALAVVAAGVGVAYSRYARTVPETAPEGSALTRAARRDLYGDAVNEAAFMRPGRHLTRSLVFVDNRGIDGLVNTTAAVIGGLSARIRRVQTGFVRSYALSMFTGAALVVAALLAVRLL
ncbi:NADH-quinone oxidoreductase subunit L [Nocardia blacklockiae]|uniref:NADH-quinone oxidoreductase subunit L n=1 Tax=Nocardia blacklockiae TaxID=480036 RepID=UPI0018960F70|nr:NADH-quinone oxidoreductase subunit L [Nocardia blacklockiae]MBF6170778.1 NADH-quinone oxidoreductase subunit L [Nocardia blacklockiae]